MKHEIMRKNLRIIRRNHNVQNMIHLNHHQKEIIQHEVDQNQDHVVEDLVTG